MTTALSISYPTDSKERQKARLKELKESGIPYAPKCAMKKVYEQHFDDCGEDFGPLECPEIEDDSHTC